MLVTGYDAQQRLVYLPESNRWYDFWTGKVFQGGLRIIADAPIERPDKLLSCIDGVNRQ